MDMKVRIFILPFFLIILFTDYRSVDVAVTFPDLKNWEKSEVTREFFPENLFDYIDGAADSYLSYQFKHLWVKEYTNASGASIKAEIYEHSNENDAFGIYSIEKASEYKFQKIGGQAYRYEDILNMVCGKYYVKLQGYDLKETAYADLETLARGIADNLDPAAALPEILGKFPQENLIHHSGMYIAENFLGYDFLKNAFASIYQKGDQTFQLFVIRGKDATDCRNMLESYLKFARQDPESVKQGLIVIHDRYNGDVYALWKDNLIIGTVECNDEPVSEEYIEKFKINLTNE